ncbi:hypothetical protein G6O69_17085 [Pseudenhygromyxa sp. WMMC2535]|uniref:hypothetical protein n=1 Tax=Pseudenhygromyxa sp. WMMC2535 TaxID=2712867 RepID=UPI0015538240|nr:hypothetical protein [Pseudenhygromyxa sp. WMMC2535]NVB39560.1 hypothetical protein [Pseudenhygromyxa sp. WMMC2535]
MSLVMAAVLWAYIDHDIEHEVTGLSACYGVERALGQRAAVGIAEALRGVLANNRARPRCPSASGSEAFNAGSWRR